MSKPATYKIEEQMHAASDSLDVHQGTRWSGMSYEDGVIAALNWVLGNTTDLPMEDEDDL